MDAKWAIIRKRLESRAAFPGNDFSQYLRPFVSAQMFMQWIAVSVVSKVVAQQHKLRNLLLIETFLPMGFDQGGFAILGMDLDFFFFLSETVYPLADISTVNTWGRHSGGCWGNRWRGTAPAL